MNLLSLAFSMVCSFALGASLLAFCLIHAFQGRWDKAVGLLVLISLVGAVIAAARADRT